MSTSKVSEEKVFGQPRVNLKAMRASVARMRRRVSAELKRHEEIIALSKEHMKLSERYLDLRALATENASLRQAQEEFRIEKNERRY
jgi:hypothetical protein